MDLASVDRFVRYAQSGKDTAWPLPAEADLLAHVNTWVALREGDKDVLKRVAGWPEDRAYRTDPLPERIADAWAHYLFGQDPRVFAAADADTLLFDDLLERDFPSELERAAGLAVSEGEVWARVYVDQAVAPRPMLEWHSRANVLPFWVGPRLMAAGIVTELPALASDAKGTVYRAMEVHVTGGVVNLLFQGTDRRLGALVDLGRHPSTEALTPAWDHGLPLSLLIRVPNRIRRDRRVGISDYAGVLDYLLDLNEAAATGAHNARLTARKRVIVSASALTPERTLNDGVVRENQPPRPRFDPTEEVFIEDPLDAELGAGGGNPFRVMEYAFDAEALIAWKRDLVESALTRVGLSPQYAGIGASGEGYAISGTALRLRLIPQDATGRGKARYWDDALPRILSAMAAVDSLPLADGGFGRPWTAPLDLPTVERQPGLPTDALEEAQRHAALLGAGAESTFTAVRELHPSWTDDEVDAEVARIEAAAPSPTSGLF